MLVTILAGFVAVTTVRPWPWPQAAGMTDTRTGVVYLHPSTLTELDHLRRGWRPRGVAFRVAAYDVLTLGHELGHRHGLRSERAADKYGLRIYGAVARRLGLTARYARALRRALGH